MNKSLLLRKKKEYTRNILKMDKKNGLKFD